ncbi:MAG TPA: hypothetical protein VH328_15260, partial [Burkholderiaceae bacterium]|nr:hypothetical protein [Burkholderiaceae bacterium]
RGRLPVEVAHQEPAADKSAALRAEAAWKKISRGEKWARIERACLSAGRTVLPKDDAELVPVRRDRRRSRRRV